MSQEYKNSQLAEDNAVVAEDNAFDWIAMLAKLLRFKKFIIIWTIVATVVGVGVALIQKRKYTVDVILAPEIQASTTSSMGLKGIASMFGLGNAQFGNPTDALNVTIFPEICSSTPFLTQLFDVPVLPYVSKEEVKNGAEPATWTNVYDYVTGKYKPKTAIALWIEELFENDEEDEEDGTVNVSHLTDEQLEVLKVLQKSISADVDKKTGVTNISVTMTDPQIAQQLADTVCQRLQDYVISYRTKKAKDDLDYYTRLTDEAKEKMIQTQLAYARAVDFDRSVILQTVSSEKQRLQQEASLAQQLYAQMDQQREVAKAKYQELKPVFAVVQPGSMPEKPVNSKRKTVLMFMFAGFVLSAAWKLFAVEFISDFKQKFKQAKDESIEEVAEEDK